MSYKDQIRNTYISQKYGSNGKRSHFKGFEGTQKVARVEFIDLFNVTEDHVTLAPQCLWNVLSHQFRNVVLKYASLV